MATATQTLAAFAVGLKPADIPFTVLERAKDAIIDTVGVASFGARFPWSRMLVEHARQYGSGAGAKCTVLGFKDLKLNAPFAAMANGALTHANEQDNLRQAGGHAGACIVPAVLAAAEESEATGQQALTAFVAATEIMFRIGLASRHSIEKLGFHAPGITGPYGATVGAGLVFGLNAEQLVNALGIAGSLGSGLLAFTKARQGTMVKRLHMARACESGILAARMAQQGYTGPETILEGKFGFLDAYCKDSDPALLTAKLKEDWEVLSICIKRYACHVTSQPAVQALRELMAKEKFSGAQVESMSVEVKEKVMSHHVITEPNDIMQGQYSLPFNLALTLYRDPSDAASFDEGAVRDAGIRAMCRSITVTLDKQPKSFWGSRIHLKLKDGRAFSTEGLSFKGMPEAPLSREELRGKFMPLVREMGAEGEKLFDHLAALETRNQVLP